MTLLKPRAKRVRRKNMPSALVAMEHHQLVENDEEHAFSLDDEPEEITHDTVLDEHQSPDEV